MNNLLLVGSADTISKYIEEYIEKYKFLSYEIEKYGEILKVEDARSIKKSLSYNVRGKRLFIITGEMTTGSQNALLKSIEEAEDNVFFIIGVDQVDDVLPTILSRCKKINCGEVVLGPVSDSHKTLMELVEEAAASHPDWSCVEKISEALEGNGLQELLMVLRTALLSNNSNQLYFSYCKRLLEVLPLVEKNNVNQKMALESIFLN